MEQICFGLNGELLENVFLVDKNGKSKDKSSKKSFKGYTFLYVNENDDMLVKKLISLGKLIEINGKYYKDKSKDKSKGKSI
jgi:hypothetical protein